MALEPALVFIIIGIMGWAILRIANNDAKREMQRLDRPGGVTGPGNGRQAPKS